MSGNTGTGITIKASLGAFKGGSNDPSAMVLTIKLHFRKKVGVTIGNFEIEDKSILP